MLVSILYGFGRMLSKKTGIHIVTVSYHKLQTLTVFYIEVAEFLISEECEMQLSSSEPCVVILTEKEVEVSVNNHATFTLPKNYLAAFACNNNVIELSTLNHVLIPHINRNIINDYLLFLPV